MMTHPAQQAHSFSLQTTPTHPSASTQSHMQQPPQRRRSDRRQEEASTATAAINIVLATTTTAATVTAMVVPKLPMPPRAAVPTVTTLPSTRRRRDQHHGFVSGARVRVLSLSARPQALFGVVHSCAHGYCRIQLDNGNEVMRRRKHISLVSPDSSDDDAEQEKTKEETEETEEEREEEEEDDDDEKEEEEEEEEHQQQCEPDAQVHSTSRVDGSSRGSPPPSSLTSPSPPPAWHAPRLHPINSRERRIHVPIIPIPGVTSPLPNASSIRFMFATHAPPASRGPSNSGSSSNTDDSSSPSLYLLQRMATAAQHNATVHSAKHNQ